MEKKMVRKELTAEDQKNFIEKIQNDLNGIESEETNSTFDFEKFDEHEFTEVDKLKVKDIMPVDTSTLTHAELIELINMEVRLLERTFVRVQKERIQFGNHLLARYRNQFPITKKMQDLYFDLEKNEFKARDILIENVQTTDLWKHFFTNVTGVAERLAGALMAEIGNISKFNTFSKVLAYFGIVPGYWIAKCGCNPPHTMMLSSNTHTTCPIKIRSEEVEIDSETGLKTKTRSGKDKMQLVACGSPLEYLEHVENLAPKRKAGMFFIFNVNGKTTTVKCVAQFLKNKNDTYLKVYEDEKKKLNDRVLATFVVPFKEQVNAPTLIEESKKRAITVDSLREIFDKIEDSLKAKTNIKIRMIKDNTKDKNKLKNSQVSKELIIEFEKEKNEKLRLLNEELKELRSQLPAKYVTTADMHIRMNKKEGKTIKGYLTPLHIHMRAQRKTGKIFLENMYRVWRVIEGLPIRKPYAFDQLGHTGDIMIFPWNRFFENFNYETNKTTINGVEMDWREFVNSNHFIVKEKKD